MLKQKFTSRLLIATILLSFIHYAFCCGTDFLSMSVTGEERNVTRNDDRGPFQRIDAEVADEEVVERSEKLWNDHPSSGIWSIEQSEADPIITAVPGTTDTSSFYVKVEKDFYVQREVLELARVEIFTPGFCDDFDNSSNINDPPLVQGEGNVVEVENSNSSSVLYKATAVIDPFTASLWDADTERLSFCFRLALYEEQGLVVMASSYIECELGLDFTSGFDVAEITVASPQLSIVKTQVENIPIPTIACVCDPFYQCYENKDDVPKYTSGEDVRLCIQLLLDNDTADLTALEVEIDRIWYLTLTQDVEGGGFRHAVIDGTPDAVTIIEYITSSTTNSTSPIVDQAVVVTPMNSAFFSHTDVPVILRGTISFKPTSGASEGHRVVYDETATTIRTVWYLRGLKPASNNNSSNRGQFFLQLALASTGDAHPATVSSGFTLEITDVFIVGCSLVSLAAIIRLVQRRTMCKSSSHSFKS